MPNVLDAEPLRAFAQRAAKKIPDAGVRARFERLAYEQLLADAANFRAACAEEIAAAPRWARTAAARDESVFVFKLSRSASTRLHNVARWLGATCELARADLVKQAHLIGPILSARRLIAKIDHAAYSVIADKAHELARAHALIYSDADLAPRCEPRVIAATGDHRWHLITSVAALHAIGREFRNCLARAPHCEQHAASLRVGRRQFWVLRDKNGAGLVVAMADAPAATHFIEVRGPNNAAVRNRQGDLARLGAAIGIPPEPTPPAQARISAVLREALRGDCVCPRCVSQRIAALLPRIAAAT